MKNLLRFLPLPALCLLPLAAAATPASESLALVNRLSWGETAQGDTLGGLAPQAWLEQQLHPSADDGLPPQVQAQIAALQISQMPLQDILLQARQLQLAARDAKGSPDAKDARKPFQQAMEELLREAQTRSLLRDLYSRNQLKEQLTWFWMNHFNVFSRKGLIRAMVGDYEENAIRPHVLGHFSDLLAATVAHPAMLQYLDNQQNAVGKINENYAREIMELHTMGVGSGYTQADVQELARILTGLSMDRGGFQGFMRGDFRRDFPAQRLDASVAVFNARRHDFGDKHFLNTTIHGQGVNEIATAVAILAAQPATARFVSRQLAQYFCCDAPSDQLVGAMAATWKRSDGDIAEILRTLFASPEFKASLGRKFKDPMHYAVSAMRAVYGGTPVANLQPLNGWLNRMGEPLYGHETPDGYPLTQDAWAGPGQMETRFEIARQIGAGARQLFRAGDEAPLAPAATPALEKTVYFQALPLPAATRAAIAQGETQADRNMLFLSSPDFMRR